MKRKRFLADTILYYEPLLHRYATRLVRDTTLAAILVQQVLEDQYDIDRLLPSKNLRLVLKTDLRNRCYYRNVSKLFDRPPVYPSKYINQPDHQSL